MTKVSKRIGLALGLAALLLGFVGVGAAQAAIPDSDISQNTVHSTAYRVGNGDTLAFYGALQAKGPDSPGVCYRMEQLTPAGNWVTSGFREAETDVVLNPAHHCSYNTAPYITWVIHDGLSVRGVRFFRYDLGGANVGTHCNTATSCRNMYQGT